MQPHLRPLDAGEILDGAFRLFRRHPAAFALAGALPLLPLLSLWGWMAYGAGRLGWFHDPEAGVLLTMLALAGGWVPATLSRAAAIRLADDALMGRPVRAGAALRAALRRIPAALWASGFGNLLVAVPFAAAVNLMGRIGEGGAAFWALYVLAWLLPAALAALWFGTLPAVVLERTGGHAGRARSRALALAAPGRVAAVWSVTFLFAWLPWVVTALLMVMSGRALEGGAEIAAWLGACLAAGAVTTPLVAVARTLLFTDLRVRAEALDVRVLADRLAAA